MADEKKIVKADVGKMPRPMPVGMFDPMPEVTVEYDDGSKEKLFSYYPDEIRFRAAEFVGLTKAEAFRLRHGKDVTYLRS